MIISGCTFVRNGFALGYPVKESISSLLALCDEVVIALGNSDDGTLEYVQSLKNPKIKIIQTVWDENLRHGGTILAQQTNIALKECKGDWIVYLQADEVIHEKDIPLLQKAMNDNLTNNQCEGFLFHYLHFFGHYDSIGVGRQWYRNEIRIVRNTGRVFSWKDAQGFRCSDTNGAIRKLQVIQIPASIYHYGWVRNPQAHIMKQAAFQRLYHDDIWLEHNLPKAEDFPACYELASFTGNHPSIMKDKILADSVWTQLFDSRITKKRPFRIAACDFIEKYTGWRIGEYRNYNLIGRLK